MWQMYIPSLRHPHPHPQEFLEQLLAKLSAPVPHYLITSTATANMQMIVGRRLSAAAFSLKGHLVISKMPQCVCFYGTML